MRGAIACWISRSYSPRLKGKRLVVKTVCPLNGCYCEISGHMAVMHPNDDWATVKMSLMPAALVGKVTCLASRFRRRHGRKWVSNGTRTAAVATMDPSVLFCGRACAVSLMASSGGGSPARSGSSFENPQSLHFQRERVCRSCWKVEHERCPAQGRAFGCSPCRKMFVRRNFSIEAASFPRSCRIHGLLVALRGCTQDVGAKEKAGAFFLVTPLALSQAAMFAEVGRLWHHVVGVPHDASRRSRALPGQVFRPVEWRHFPIPTWPVPARRLA